MNTTVRDAGRNGDGLTVFDRAAARIKAVQEMDKLIARQKEQVKELEAQAAQMEELRRRWQAALLDNTDTLHVAVHKYEAQLIKTAIQQSDGSLTNIGSLLGVSYQAVAHMFETRHKALQHLRLERKNRKKKIDENR